MTREYSSANVFVDNNFDRLAEKRKDTRWLSQAIVDENSLYVPVWKHRSPIDVNALTFAKASDFQSLDNRSPILLGEVRGAPCFAVDLGDDDKPPGNFRDWHFSGLRTIGTQLPAVEAALAAFAQAMVFWLRQHRFCGACGSPTLCNEAGHVLDCSSETCFHRSFPRSDPAVIVLASDGDRILLGRQASWPAGRYSTIAGFVEPGESLEAAARREVAEETGHTASDVRYFSSQPWPFPSSLMLGFLATVSPVATREPDEELEDVRWFTRPEIVERTRNGPPLLPPPLSIAYRLIEHWFDMDSEKPLSELTPL